MFTSILKDPQRQLPKNVSREIQDAIIKERCGVEPTFLNGTNKELTDFMSIFTDGGMNDIGHPLNSKDQLCPIIRDLNTISDKSLARKIYDCVTLLKVYTPEALGLTENSVEYKTIKKEVDTFDQWVRNWKDVDSYICKTENCVTQATRLKGAADEVRKYADSCTKSIENRHKSNLRERKKTGDHTLTFREKFATWF
jgi:hypothetical protein